MKSSFTILMKPVTISDDYKQKMKILSANSLVMYVRSSALHYLVQGTTFADIHKTTDGYYQKFQEMYDFLNERLIQLHIPPIKSLKEANTLQNILKDADDKNEYTPEEVCSELARTFRIMTFDLKRLKESSGEAKDYQTEDWCVQQLYFFEKEAWMLDARNKKNSIRSF